MARPPHRQALGAYLRSLRTERGLSLRSAARLCGISHVQLRALEKSLHAPTAPTLNKLARGYSVDATELLSRVAAA